MVDNLFFTLTFIAAIGCGLNAGLFFIFSNTIMGSLARLKPSAGIAAMQSINRLILNPLFFIVFFGTAIVCLVLAVSLFWRWHLPGSVYLLAGSLVFLFGVILVTILFNVPMNEALDKVKPETGEAEDIWSRYLRNWTAWNHARTVASLLGTVLFMLGLV